MAVRARGLRLETHVAIRSSGGQGVGRLLGSRDARDALTKYQSRQRRLNLILARQLQEEVVSEMERVRLEWREVAGSGTLARAIMDPRNIVADNHSFGVGVPEVMYEIAPYWKIQDQGTRRFVGRQIGFVRGEAQGFPDPHEAFSTVTAQGATMEQDKTLPAGVRMSSGKTIAVIQEPIQAMHFFKNAVAAFDLPLRARAAVLEALRGE